MNNNTDGGRLRFVPRRGAAKQRDPLLARNRVIRVAFQKILAVLKGYLPNPAPVIQ